MNASNEEPLGHIETLRALRGWMLAQSEQRAVARLVNAGREIFDVPSERFGRISYQVLVDEDGVWVCTCDDFRCRREPCKHIAEVLYRFFPALAPPPTTATLGESEGPDPSWYRGARRNPSAPHLYKEGLAESTRRDHSLETRDSRVESLLLDLASVINLRTPSVCEVGRPTLPPGDKIVVMGLRDHHRKSLRGFQPILKRLAAEHKIAFAACKNSLVAYNNDASTLDILRCGFHLTVAPFVLMEQDVIIDSSGFSTFYTSCWRTSDYGTRNRVSGTKWFKLHLAIGRLSRAILGFIVTANEGDGTSDHANFRPLLDGLVRQGFDLRYVIADNAYLSEENNRACKDIGAFLVSPLKERNFKRNAQPTEAARPIAAFKKSNPDLYDELCRARQPVEGVFSVEKRRGNRIASVGTKQERLAMLEEPEAFLFVSRENEFWTRALRYNLNLTVTEEVLRNRSIRYSKGSVFSHVREFIGDHGDGSAA